ncbi:MAG: FKBP-type peptidyl-prolyl cis-trans isomerase [Bacteroidota bacterium]
MYFNRIYFAIAVMVFMIGCNPSGKDTSDKREKQQEDLEEALIEANKSAVEAEKEMIFNYARRHKWPLKKAKGIYYAVYENGEGQKIEIGDEVVFTYSLELINGSEIKEYGKPEPIKVGEGGDVVSGLHRALQLLKEGDRAKVIVPSHLAYGLAGDQDKIPSKATLIYDIKVMDVVSRQSD